MGKKRRAVEPVRLEDGHYWFRNFVNLDGGGHVGVWKMARVVAGKVRRIGSEAEWEQGCPYLRDALWVRAEPPALDAEEATAIRPAALRRPGKRAGRAEHDEAGSGERVRIVAQGIVEAFLETHEPVGAHYRRRPDQKAELVAQIARLIERVRK